MMIMFLILIIMVLISVAFFTLLERKILGYIQTRIGPNKTYLLGILQPLADGLKLFLKENKKEWNINMIYYLMFPFMSLIIMMMYWMNYTNISFDNLMFAVIYFLLISGISVYSTLGSGWASNSKYSLLGTYRSISQVVSYEVGMVFMIMSFMLITNNYNIFSFLEKDNKSHMLIFMKLIFFIMWIVIILAELNRAPFDFSESESELVSGFNIEYGALKFAFLFLSEYGSMMFMSYLTMMLFFNQNFIWMIIIMNLMIWVRAVFPRFRYDNLMFLNWKIFLPNILFMFMLMYMTNNIY